MEGEFEVKDSSSRIVEFGNKDTKGSPELVAEVPIKRGPGRPKKEVK